MFNFIKKIKEKRRIKNISKALFRVQKIQYQIGVDFRKSFPYLIMNTPKDNMKKEEKPTPKKKCNNCGAEALQPNGACQICTACGSQVGGC